MTGVQTCALPIYGRTQLWINSLPALKKYWAVGSGPDTFKYTYPQNSGLIFDKAHNVYLQMGITTGIFSVIVYLGMLFIITLKGFKLNDPYAIGLYGAFIAYSVQAFANISVIEVAPIFFIVLGLLVNYEGEDLFKRRVKHEKIS